MKNNKNEKTQVRRMSNRLLQTRYRLVQDMKTIFEFKYSLTTKVRSAYSNFERFVKWDQMVWIVIIILHPFENYFFQLTRIFMKSKLKKNRGLLSFLRLKNVFATNVSYFLYVKTVVNFLMWLSILFQKHRNPSLQSLQKMIGKSKKKRFPLFFLWERHWSETAEPNTTSLFSFSFIQKYL